MRWYISNVSLESSALAMCHAPPNGMYKINWNTGLDSKIRRMRFGIIVRNFEGWAIAAKAQTVCIAPNTMVHGKSTSDIECSIIYLRSGA
jgi:hypothetical protein